MPCVYDRDGIKMYLYPQDHPPAHIHVHARGHVAVIDIATEVLLLGKIRKNDLRYALRVIANNKARLLQGFNDAISHKSPKRID